MPVNLIRLCGLAAMLGSVLTPILTYMWTSYSGAYGCFGRAIALV
jgi:hypothetical protein